MNNPSVTDAGHLVSADEIPWTSEPVARAEDVELLMLSEPELWHYASDLQHEARWLRRLSHAALAEIARLIDALGRASRIIDHQRQQLRAQREQV